MFRKTMNAASRCVLAALVGLGLMTAATGCDESGYLAYESGYYGSGEYSSIIGVQADNVDTLMGNFIDYGDGVPWVIE